jgi:hypothetical protein
MTINNDKTSAELFSEALEAYGKEAVEKFGVGLEKELRKKYAKGKGKDIVMKFYCHLCTQHFELKRKNNKSDATAKQMCPHLTFSNWEVDHDGS